MLSHQSVQLLHVPALLCLSNLEAVMDEECAMFEAELKVVAPAFPLRPILLHHVPLCPQQHEGVAHSNYQRLGTGDGSVEDVSITDALGGVAGGSILVSGLRGAQEESPELTT